MRFALILAALVCAAGPGLAQLTINLDHLAKQAKESVEITLDGELLRLAGRFLSSSKPDEVKAKEVVSGLKSIYVRSFEFDRTGAFSESDIDAIRSQIQSPGWTRIVRATSGPRKGRDLNEIAEVYVRSEAGKSTGIAIIAAEAKELTVVQILGDIDLEKLEGLSGQFGIPKLPKAVK
jgi:hypothetical protein